MEKYISHDLFFLIVVVVSLIIDFYFFSPKNKEMSMSSALWQSVFWVGISLLFGIYVNALYGNARAIEYYTAYVMEKSLSIDNIFVFLLIFKSFKISPAYVGRALLWGILIAIVFRVIFIIVGVALLQKFEWLLVVFGLFLLVTGFKILFEKEDAEVDPHEGKVYKFLSKIFRVSKSEGHGKFLVKNELGQNALSQVGLVIIMLGVTDFIFAMDSLPTVLAISQNQFVVMSSNIFAILGLRALFFLLKNANDRFENLQKGVALVLIFIGVKLIFGMLGVHIKEWISLAVVLFCLGASLLPIGSKSKTID